MIRVTGRMAAAAETVAWTGALPVLWIMPVGTVDRWELLVGGLAVAASGAAARGARTAPPPVNGWPLTAAGTLAGGVVGTAVEGATGPLHRRVFARNLASPLGCAAVLLLAHGYGRPAYVDIGLLLALLGPVGTPVCPEERQE